MPFPIVRTWFRFASLQPAKGAQDEANRMALPGQTLRDAAELNVGRHRMQLPLQ